MSKKIKTKNKIFISLGVLLISILLLLVYKYQPFLNASCNLGKISEDYDYYRDNGFIRTDSKLFVHTGNSEIYDLKGGCKKVYSSSNDIEDVNHFDSAIWIIERNNTFIYVKKFTLDFEELSSSEYDISGLTHILDDTSGQLDFYKDKILINRSVAIGITSNFQNEVDTLATLIRTNDGAKTDIWMEQHKVAKGIYLGDNRCYTEMIIENKSRISISNCDENRKKTIDIPVSTGRVPFSYITDIDSEGLLAYYSVNDTNNKLWQKLIRYGFDGKEISRLETVEGQILDAVYTEGKVRYLLMDKKVLQIRSF